MTLLGNDYRFFKVAVLLITIASLCVFSYLDNSPESMFTECIASPYQCPGATIHLGDNTKIASVRNGNYELITRYGNIVVKGDVDPDDSGRIVNVILRINPTGGFETDKIYVRPYRMMKIVVSIVPVLFVSILFIRKYYFSFEKMIFVKR